MRFASNPSECLSALAHSLLVGLVWAVASASGNLFAQVDRIYPITGNPVVGKITDIRPQAVAIEAGSATQTIPVDRIRRIIFQDEPNPLTRGRDFALDGDFAQAIDSLTKVDFGAIKRDVIKADAMFFLARSEAALALSGRGNLAEATRKMNGFVSANRQSYHFFKAARILGDLAVASGSYEPAIRYYAALSQAPIPELKIEADYLTGVAHLRQGNPSEAQSFLEKAIGAGIQSVDGLRLQKLAKAAQSLALAKQGQAEQGLAQLDSLIAELDLVDAELAASIYNSQGACFESLDDAEGAVLAYLHTHLMFSGQAAAHAEALQRLIELWPQVGKPERAAQARQELQQRYPGRVK